MESFEGRGFEPKREDAPGISQERIDDAFAVLVRGGHLFEQSPSIVKDLLAADGIEAKDEDLENGEIAADESHGDRYVDIDARANAHGGTVTVTVDVSDKFHPAEGESFKFSKTYELAASPEALKALQAAREKENREWEAQKAEGESSTKTMLVKLRAFVGDRMGERLTAEEWKTGSHGVMEVFGGPDSVPVGGSWMVEETPDHAIRIAFYGADGMVLDIAEFAAGNGQG